MTPKEAAEMFAAHIREAIEGAKRAGFEVDFDSDSEWGLEVNHRLIIYPRGDSKPSSEVTVWPVKKVSDAPQEEAGE